MDTGFWNWSQQIIQKQQWHMTHVLLLFVTEDLPGLGL